MAFTINGPNGGNATILGNTSGDDIINAFDFNNVIISGGANDQIFTGSGFATVNLGAFVGVTDTVNVGGANNTVSYAAPGTGNSTLTVQGGTGNNVVTLANSQGNNAAAMQGFNNVVTVNSDAHNVILTGAGRGTVHAGVVGDGNTGFSTSVTAAGQNNTVIGGDQNFFVSGGQGFDFISVGNGNNTVFEAGTKDKITVGTGSNTIIDLGGAATILFNGFVEDINDLDSVTIGGTNNTVTETAWATHSERDFTITGGTGNGRFTLGDGANILTTAGSNNVVNMGSTEPPVPGTEESGEASGDAVTIAGGTANQVTLGNGNNVVSVDGTTSTINLGAGNNLVTANGNNDSITVGGGVNHITANGNSDTIVAGSGGNTIVANGDDDTITAAGGNNNVTADGKLDTITLGNGANTLEANGNTDTITLGNGPNSVTAGGNGDVINLGTGSNTVSATGNNDTITSLGGKGTFTIGGNTSLSLTASSAGTTIAAQGANDTITLNGGSNAAITDSPFGGSLNLVINAAAGVVKLTGFGSDPTGVINVHAIFAGNSAAFNAALSSDGLGGTLINLGGAGHSLDLVGTTVNNAQFVV